MKGRSPRFLSSPIALLFLLVVFAATAAHARKGDGVTFENKSQKTQYVLAVWGEGKSCDKMSEKSQLTLEPGGRSTVESGADRVCWCASTAGKVGSCGDAWRTAKAGSTKRITF